VSSRYTGQLAGTVISYPPKLIVCVRSAPAAASPPFAPKASPLTTTASAARRICTPEFALSP
jgi:hypothetical protein